MKTAFSQIDLSKLPAPSIVETIDFEAIVADMKTQLIALTDEAGHDAMAATLALESEPLVKAIQVFAYREVILRTRINDAAKAVMLPFAGGADLDNLAALVGVQRQVVQEGDALAVPPVPEILEDDARLRRRAQLALEGFSTAGPSGAYVFHGLSADPSVKDIGVASPEPGIVEITVLSILADGAASDALLENVGLALTSEDVRPLTDNVLMQSAQIIPYQIDAMLTFMEGADIDLVHQAALDEAATYTQEKHALGHDITLSGIYAALHQPGVHSVRLDAPLADIVVASQQAAYCTDIAVTKGGRDV